jgi:EAL domain-containing protein (putative c-di-GMP-specific phosphodiesterase class I)
MSDLHKEIISILDGKLLTPHFQPIVSLTTKVSKNSNPQLQSSAGKLQAVN